MKFKMTNPTTVFFFFAQNVFAVFLCTKLELRSFWKQMSYYLS